MEATPSALPFLLWCVHFLHAQCPDSIQIPHRHPRGDGQSTQAAHVTGTGRAVDGAASARPFAEPSFDAHVILSSVENAGIGPAQSQRLNMPTTTPSTSSDCCATMSA